MRVDTTSEFVRTQEEIEQTRARMAENCYVDARQLSVRYLTDPEQVAHVLPPGLEPTDTLLVEATIVEGDRSNCVGAFAGGGLYVQAQHEGRTSRVRQLLFNERKNGDGSTDSGDRLAVRGCRIQVRFLTARPRPVSGYHFRACITDGRTVRSETDFR